MRAAREEAPRDLAAAQSIAHGADAELGTYKALAEALSRSPALLNNDLLAFEAEGSPRIPGRGGPGYPL